MAFNSKCRSLLVLQEADQHALDTCILEGLLCSGILKGVLGECSLPPGTPREMLGEGLFM